MATARTNTGSKDRKHQETDFYPADIWVSVESKEGEEDAEKAGGRQNLD